MTDPTRKMTHGLPWLSWLCLLASPLAWAQLPQAVKPQDAKVWTSASAQAPLQDRGQAAAQPLVQVHQVKKGDTLWAISAHYRGLAMQWPHIALSNQIDNPKRLQPGQFLILGGVSDETARNYALVVAVHGGAQAWLPKAGGPVGRSRSGASLPAAPQSWGESTAPEGAVTLTTGQWLPVGTVVQTGAQGFVTLALSPILSVAQASQQSAQPNKHAMLRTAVALATLPSHSQIRIANLQQQGAHGDEPAIVLDLIAGQVDSRVQPLSQATDRREAPFFQIRSKIAKTWVRGTYFRVALPSQSQTLATSVLEGQVAQQADDQAHKGQGQMPVVLAKEGMGIAQQGGALQLQTLLPAPAWSGEVQNQSQPQVWMQWQAVPGAVRYRVQWARDAWFTDIVAQQDVVADKVSVLPATEDERKTSTPPRPSLYQTRLADLPSGHYFARVSAINAEGVEGGFNLTSLVRGGAYSLQGQAVPSVNQPDAIDLTWDELPQAVYSLEIKEFGQPDSAPIVQRDGLTQNRITLAQLPPGQYVWQVRAVVHELGQSQSVVSSALPLVVSGAR